MTDYYFPNAGSSYSTLVAQSEYPSKLDTDNNLVPAENKATTTLTSNINTSATTIAVVDASGFSVAGVLVCENEVMTYSGRTATSFTGVVRAFEGTTAANHNSGAAIEQQITKSSNNVKNNAIRELELKVGTTSSTPTAGFALIGTGNGSSQWLPTREVLADNRNYYVSASAGNDSNDGRTTSTQFATINKAVDAASRVDANGYNITINVANGTYAEQVFLKNVNGVSSASALNIVGNTTTPSSVSVRQFNATDLTVSWNIRGFKTENALPTPQVIAINSTLRIQNWEFGACHNTSNGNKNTHMASWNGGVIYMNSNYTISGTASSHCSLLGDSFIDCQSRAVTVVGTIDIGYYIIMNYLCFGYFFGQTWSAQMTGVRYSVAGNSICFINNATPNTYLALAGNVNGSTSTGGLIY